MTKIAPSSETSICCVENHPNLLQMQCLDSMRLGRIFRGAVSANRFEIMEAIKGNGRFNLIHHY